VLLGTAFVVAHVRERDQVAHVHAQALLVAAPEALLCEARREDHRAGYAAAPLAHVRECTCRWNHCNICHQSSTDSKFFIDNLRINDDPCYGAPRANEGALHEHQVYTHPAHPTTAAASARPRRLPAVGAPRRRLRAHASRLSRLEGRAPARRAPR